jgi:hypothetical protein
MSITKTQEREPRTSVGKMTEFLSPNPNSKNMAEPTCGKLPEVCGNLVTLTSMMLAG